MAPPTIAALLLFVALCHCSWARQPPSSWLVTELLGNAEDISRLPELGNVALGRPVARSPPLRGGGLRGEGGELEGVLRSVTDGFVNGRAKLGTALEMSLDNPSLVVDLGRVRRIEEVLFYSELGNNTAAFAPRVSVSFLDEEGEEIAPAEELRSLTKLFRWVFEDLPPKARYVCLTLADVKVPLAITEVEVYSPADPDDPQVPEAHKVQLLLTFFTSKSPTRAKEQKDSLVRNLRNPYIAGADVLTESCQDFPFKHPKIRLRCVSEQPLYGDFFQHANEHLLGRTVLLTNGDIVYTSSLAHVHRRLAPQGEFFVLHRWSLPCPQDFPKERAKYNYCETAFGAYDSYVFHPPVSQAVIEALDVPMNRWNAEHEAMFRLIVTQGWNATNPCVDLIGYHNHCSELREWKKGLTKGREAVYVTHVARSSASDEQPSHRYRVYKKTRNPDGSLSSSFLLRSGEFSKIDEQNAVSPQ